MPETPTTASRPLAPKDEAERLQNVLSIVYGLLFPVPVDRETEAGERIAQARRWCRQELSKEQQGEGIGDANFLIHAREPHPPFKRPDWLDRLTKPDPNS